ncbi:gamma-glutamyl-gamma-aminobutyrate hydrolase family protein [Mechercharimyces sp. CAU 1602]|uniref:gamma-glutamyl-gamma-aminobutyrate hydrolase family protein n=1 Tax=Mechercharimyces sp. CAU 1602 TaxID=2973933 RepID=UPI0021617F05|nr:gamma-glutamyl-gamma-aminobutyrate hydrolase family protein [Mechercharimyces sp. CAU 1602]MCS1350555.1 gamma-glutamyl-gamma-aminobutyrate hydrolase family protein [Mechercharimyces sp. CAU 1602]
MRPLIGVTASLREETFLALHRDNVDAILRAGGMPLALPYTVEAELIEEMVYHMDGLYLTGGGDIDPSFFHEEPLPGLREIIWERDQMEVLLIRRMMELDKPIFAVCRGCQMLNIAQGGDMYQDITSQCNFVLQHEQEAARHHCSHSIEIEEDSRLFRIYQKKEARVNSFHHQALRQLAPCFIGSAHSKDGLIEAIESKEHSFVLGVQWHPENCSNDEGTQKLYRAFIRAANAN